mgnify:CR=1 FL=1
MNRLHHLRRDERGMSFVFVGVGFLAFVAATTLTDADIENLAVELDSIRQDIEDSRGERDARTAIGSE